jgi:ATP-dependent Clp protease ATP-binding subunit ClpA
MFERFTTAAREVVVSAQHEREEFGHPVLGTEHVLLGLLNEGAGMAYTVLHRAGLTRIQVREAVRNVVGHTALGDDDAEALKAIGIDLDEVRARVESTFGPGALQAPLEPRRGLFGRRGRPGRVSQRARKVLELSLREAIRLHDKSIGPEHLLLGLLREGEGLAVKIMVDRGLVLDDLREQVLAEIKAGAS